MPLARWSGLRPVKGRLRSPAGRPTAYISDFTATGLMAL
jgi:hypothetical protein